MNNQKSARDGGARRLRRDELSRHGTAADLVEQPTYEIGGRAAELLRRVAGEDFPAQRIVLPATLKIRQSTSRYTPPATTS